MEKKGSRNETADEDLSISRLLQATFDSTESVRFIVDAKGTVIHFNRKAYENSILIHNRELKKGDNLFNFAADTVNDVESPLREQLNRAFKGETFWTDSEVKFDENSRWFETEYIPIIINRKIVAVAISTSEITSKKVQEIRLAELLNEVKSSSQHRLQEAELTLDVMARRVREIVEDIPRSDKLLKKQARTLCANLVSLRRKVGLWRKLT
jgi:hypothetical protein